MSWLIYRFERQAEVMDRLANERVRDARHELVRDWILTGEWHPGLDLHIRNGMPSLESRCAS